MNFEDLVAIVAKLRGPDGCPWDREQSRESLRHYLVEEFYELIDALEDNDHKGMREELGDLLFQIILQSQLSKEEGRFDIHAVIDGIAGKMVRRHPHVFGNKELKTSEEVEEWWKDHKKKEGKDHDSAIDGVPRSLPALLIAQQIQLKATKVGFDWDKIDDVFSKLEEEVSELKEAVSGNNYAEIVDEFGDMLFVLVRIANFVNVNPEDALRRTIKKFIGRFSHMETDASLCGKKLSDMTLAEMNVLWEKAKNS
jgi:tetrapyrrole methylase family protein/MazG family protein